MGKRVNFGNFVMKFMVLITVISLKKLAEKVVVYFEWFVFLLLTFLFAFFCLGFNLFRLFAYVSSFYLLTSNFLRPTNFPIRFNNLKLPPLDLPLLHIKHLPILILILKLNKSEPFRSPILILRYIDILYGVVLKIVKNITICCFVG